MGWVIRLSCTLAAMVTKSRIREWLSTRQIQL